MAKGDSIFEQWATRFRRLMPQAVAFTDTVFRSCTPRYANETDILTGEGSKRHGGRWNPAGIAMVYASLSPETAMAETLAYFRHYGIPLQQAMPRTFVAIAASLQAVLDLRQGWVRQRLHVAQKQILTVDWRGEMRAGREPITQTIGRAALEAGLEGLIVPSAADRRGHNLLVLPENLRPQSRLMVEQAERL